MFAGKFTKAADIRIGDVVGFKRVKRGEPQEPITVKTINELCNQYPGPHVHLVTTDGHVCREILK